MRAHGISRLQGAQKEEEEGAWHLATAQRPWHPGLLKAWPHYMTHPQLVLCGSIRTPRQMEQRRLWSGTDTRWWTRSSSGGAAPKMCATGPGRTCIGAGRRR